MKIAVFGAGSVGCLIGGSLLAKENDVVFVVSKRVGDAIERHGLTISDLKNRRVHIPQEKIIYSQSPEIITGCDIILLCVKCPHTREAAHEIAAHIDEGAVVYSLQNGVGNTAILREEIKDNDIVAAMVGFNAVSLENNRIHRATEAELVLGKNVASHELARLLKKAHISTTISDNMENVLWGKLCLNLNNAINVLSDMPLRQQLKDRKYRKVLAICVSEALEVINAKGISLTKIGKIRPKHIPFILNLPDWLFGLVARSLMKMDDEARSSMWEDLQKGREPEIDQLNGAIVKAGEENMVATPANQSICSLVYDAFEKGQSPRFSGEELLQKINP